MNEMIEHKQNTNDHKPLQGKLCLIEAIPKNTKQSQNEQRETA